MCLNLTCKNAFFLGYLIKYFFLSAMHEESEIINLVLSILLFFYFLVVLKKSELKVPSLWKFAMVSIIMSNASTIIEGYFFFDIFNCLEHALYMVAGLLFLIGAFQFKTFKRY